MNIILVDDNLRFRSDLKFFLENKLNHTVIAETANGEDFLELENFKETDLILMDLSLGSMNGFEATKIILEFFPNLKIIAMTMYMENVALLKLIESGFQGFIFKTHIYSSLETVLQSVYSDTAVYSDRFHIM